jgi:hypothetical protein
MATKPKPGGERHFGGSPENRDVVLADQPVTGDDARALGRGPSDEQTINRVHTVTNASALSSGS